MTDYLDRINIQWDKLMDKKITKKLNVRNGNISPLFGYKTQKDYKTTH